jgi:hypothetical protein
MTGNKNRRWTEGDDHRLLELKGAGRSSVSISAALKRSAGAIEGRLSIIRARARATKDAGGEASGSDDHHVDCKGT